MMKVEEGRMLLNDPLAKFMPQLGKMEVAVTENGKTAREPAKRQMTIQDLFRHTAGFAYGEFSNVPEIKAAYAEAKLYQPGITAESRMITPDQFVTGIAKAPLVHEPGTTWEYGMAVDVLGRGFIVRQGPGLAGVPGSEGEYMWAGAGGTFFWIDPKEQLAVVYMAQTPGAIRPYYRRMIKALVAQALEN